MGQLMIDKARTVIRHRLADDNRLAVADTDRMVWLDPDTQEPIRIAIGTKRERDAAIHQRLMGGCQEPVHGDLYCLTSALIPCLCPQDVELLDESVEQRTSLDQADREYDDALAAFEKGEATKPVREPRYLTAAGSVVKTPPTATAEK